MRAASGVVSLNSLNNSHPAAALGLGFGGGNQPKLSPERKHKLREQATQKLARAYRLDEIACSVATMQSASALEDVASLVLKRDPNNLDAKYVHFFHEKIPSRQLAESTSLDTLNDVISGQQSEGEPLRTRATVRVFKEDYEGAAKDLTEALQVFRAHKAHSMAGKSRELQIVEPGGRRLDVKLDEDQQPSSLEIQLLFARAGVYLSIACLHVNEALLPMPAATKAKEPEKEDTRQPTDGVGGKSDVAEATESGASTPATDVPPPELTPAERESQRRVLEARKIVKSNAKKALRDYMAYLSNFDYSPNLPTDIAEDFTRKVKAGKNKGRRPASHMRSDSPSGEVAHTVYTLNELFAATPPADLPPYPPTDVTLAGPEPGADATYVGTTMELVTYHPLMTDALHALLLCHVLVQTSTKELQRHAYMVARLARLADGYPMFQASRSPARADWIEVLRRGDNWIGLAIPWESLCAAAPLYPGQSSQNIGPGPSARQGQKALPAPEAAREPKKDIDDEDRERINQQALMRAIEDDRVGDEATLRAAISAHRKRAEDDLRAERMDGGGEANGVIVPVAANGGGPRPAPLQDAAGGSDKPPSSSSSSGRAPSPGTAHRRWAMDEGREYPILTERASAVARWLREAPPGAGGTHSKKKKKAAAAPAA